MLRTRLLYPFLAYTNLQPAERTFDKPRSLATLSVYPAKRHKKYKLDIQRRLLLHRRFWWYTWPLATSFKPSSSGIIWTATRTGDRTTSLRHSEAPSGR
jgi:hypothetical protein